MNYSPNNIKSQDQQSHDGLLLSIIVPVYNVERYVRACIESIYHQGLDESTFEVIIVNDGSTDHSMERIQDIIEAHSNITVINQENLSLSVARNNGIAAAKGEYILMPDSDDLLIEESLPILLEKALLHKADLVVADFLEMTDEGINNLTTIPRKKGLFKQKSGEKLFLEDLNPTQCYVWRTLYRREFLINNHLTFVPGIRYEDFPFTHECYLKAKRCLRAPHLLNIYRKGHASATSSFNKKKAFDLCIAIASTWKLRGLKGLNSQVTKKLNNDIYKSFSLLIYFMLYGLKDAKERDEVYAFLRQEVPDLHFSDGTKQKITWTIFNFSPRLYFSIRKLLKKYTPRPNFGR